MLTIQKIREDLNDIRFYYSKQKALEHASKTVVQSSIIDKVNKYNQAVKDAPIRLYDLYISLYIHNNTQAALADDWDCSERNIGLMTRQLLDFLVNAIN